MILDNYTFDPVSRVINFIGNRPLKLEGFKLIINVSTGDVIYQFNEVTKLATLSGENLSLAFNTSGMDASDKLMIIYEEPNDGPFKNIIAALNSLLSLVARPPFCVNTSTGPALKSVIDSQSVISVSALPTLANITTLQTCQSLTNLAGVGGYNAVDLIFLQHHTNYNTGFRSVLR